MTTDTKLSNPKDRIGSTKLPLDIVPSTLVVNAALAYLEGALKYGAFNWRVAGVRMSIYLAALQRHLFKLINGEWADPQTKVPHLASIVACAGIILDAKLCGKLTDDRPPPAQVSKLIDETSETVKHLQHLFKDHAPRHWTIADFQRAAETAVTLAPPGDVISPSVRSQTLQEQWYADVAQEWQKVACNCAFPPRVDDDCPRHGTSPVRPLTAEDAPHQAPADEPRHVCGLQGFGRGLGSEDDACPACRAAPLAPQAHGDPIASRSLRQVPHDDHSMCCQCILCATRGLQKQ